MLFLLLLLLLPRAPPPPTPSPPSPRFKRNRLRHKQNMADMEKEVAHKLQELQLLSAENAALKSKTQVGDSRARLQLKVLALTPLTPSAEPLLLALCP